MYYRTQLNEETVKRITENRNQLKAFITQALTAKGVEFKQFGDCFTAIGGEPVEIRIEEESSGYRGNGKLYVKIDVGWRRNRLFKEAKLGWTQQRAEEIVEYTVPFVGQYRASREAEAQREAVAKANRETLLRVAKEKGLLWEKDTYVPSSVGTADTSGFVVTIRCKDEAQLLIALEASRRIRREIVG